MLTHRTELRKRILALVITASVIFGVIGGAGVATASAANCQFGFTPIRYGTWHGYPEWAWELTASGCTGVNAVEFEGAGPGHAYIVDINHSGTVHFSNSGGGIAGNSNCPEAAGTYWGTYFNNIWGAGCPYSFPVYKRARARIHNIARGGSWGSWYDHQSLQEAIC